MRTFIYLILLCILSGCTVPQKNEVTEASIVRTQLVFEFDKIEEIYSVVEAIEALRYTEKLFGRTNVYFAIDSIKFLSRNDYDSIDSLFYSARLDETRLTIFFLGPQEEYLGIAGLTIIPYSDWGAGTIIFGRQPNRIFAHEMFHNFNLEHSWEDDLEDTPWDKYASTNVMDYAPTPDDMVTVTEQQLDRVINAIHKYHQDKLIK